MKRSLGRSVLAFVAGVIVAAGLALGTDEILHLTSVYPPWTQRMSDALFALATTYRAVYSIGGGYVMARLAPCRPMLHAMVGGVAGTAAGIAGAVATWNLDLGPHWYSILVAAIAIPCAWAGGKIRLMQSSALTPR